MKWTIPCSRILNPLTMVIFWMKKGNNITYQSAIGSLTESYIFNARPGGPHIKMQIVIVQILIWSFPTDSTVCVQLVFQA